MWLVPRYLRERSFPLRRARSALGAALSLLLFVWMAGCSGPRSAAELPPEVPATQGEPSAPAESVDAPATTEPVGAPAEPETTPDPSTLQTPAEAYAACRDRVEGVESAGECTTDADCVAVGCSGEVCVATAQASEVMTTCEVRACFQALDACGCHEGLCSWTLKAEMPALKRLPLPAR